MSISYEKSKNTINNTQNLIKQVVSLQVRTPPYIKKKIRKEWISLSASLSIEAAFSLLLFLFASLSLIYPLYIMGMQGQIQQALETVGDELTQASYLGQDFDANPNMVSIMSTIYAENRVVSILNQKQIDISMIDGMSFLESSIMTDGNMVDIVIQYKIKMPFPLFSLKALSFVQRSRRRGWIGTEMRFDSGENIQVYVTDHGEVYHKSLSCSHLKTHIQNVTRAQIAGLRNESGAKYYPCEVCEGDKGDAESIYISKYGNRYHVSISCRELSISINSISISEVGDKTPCKSCYGK